MLALAAAGSVFEMGGTVHRLNVLAFSFVGRFLSLLLVVVRLQLAAWK